MTKSFLGKNYRAVLSELVLFSPDDEKVYELTIKEKKKKRSLDANAYCWVLLKQLSKKLRIPPIELYKEFIRRGNAYTVVTLKTEAAAKYGEIWANNGIGWICEEIGERNGHIYGLLGHRHIVAGGKGLVDLGGLLGGLPFLEQGRECVDK